MQSDPYIDRATCPHCGGATAPVTACCVCRGAGVLTTWTRLAAAVASIWARVGCACRACLAAGPRPLLLVALLALAGCANILVGGTPGHPEYEQAQLDVTVGAFGWRTWLLGIHLIPVHDAVLDVGIDAEESAPGTDGRGAATVYVHWPQRRFMPADEGGEYHAVLLTVRAVGYQTWSSLIKVRPARTARVLVLLTPIQSKGQDQ